MHTITTHIHLYQNDKNVVNSINLPDNSRQQRVYSNTATSWSRVLCPIARLKDSLEAQGRTSRSSVTETSGRPPRNSNRARHMLGLEREKVGSGVAFVRGSHYS